MQKKSSIYPFILLFLVSIFTTCGCNSNLSSSQNTNNSNPPSDSILINKQWDVDYQMGANTKHSRMTLKQDGQQFFGEGTDESGVSYTIINGEIKGSHIDFFKKYPSNTPQAIAVQYEGTFSTVDNPNYHGPFLTGTYYYAESDSKPIAGEWRARVADLPPIQQNIQQQPAVNSENSKQAPKAEFANQATPPRDLSGTWQAAYECNSVVIKSTMLLKQEGNHITGSGVDQNTKEKFIIENGWYKYPELILVRQYLTSKGAHSDRSIIFEANVSMVNASDYQGPYLNGQTQSGGSWEAQLK